MGMDIFIFLATRAEEEKSDHPIQGRAKLDHTNDFGRKSLVNRNKCKFRAMECKHQIECSASQATVDVYVNVAGNARAYGASVCSNIPYTAADASPHDD